METNGLDAEEFALIFVLVMSGFVMGGCFVLMVLSIIVY